MRRIKVNLFIGLGISGLSLVETVVSLAIFAFMSVTIFGFMAYQSRVTQSLKQSQAVSSFVQGVGSALSNNKICQGVFAGTSLPAGWQKQNLSRIAVGGQVLADTSTYVDQIKAKSITLNNLNPGFTGYSVKVDKSLPPSTTPNVVSMYQYFAELNLSFEKLKDSDGPSVGGSNLLTRKFYLSFLVDQATNQLYDCFSSDSKDFFQEMCTRQLGGQYDETQYPACLLMRLALAGSTTQRDILMTAITSQSVPGGITYKSGISTEGALKLSATGAITFGAASGNQQIAYLGKCSTADCNAGVLGISHTVLSGTPNPNFPPAKLSGGASPNRVISVADHLILPQRQARLGVSEDFSLGPTLPKSALHVRATAAGALGANGAKATAILDSDSQATVALMGPGELPGAGSYACTYWNKAGAAGTYGMNWVMGYRVDQEPEALEIAQQKPTLLYMSFFPQVQSTIFHVDVTFDRDLIINGPLLVNNSVLSMKQVIVVSDKNLKRDIRPLDDVLEKTLELIPVRFRWKDSSIRGGVEQIGFIAQDVEPLFPELVYTNPDTNRKSLAHFQFLALVTKAIHEEHSKIDSDSITQEQKLKDLEERLSRLRSRLQGPNFR